MREILFRGKRKNNGKWIEGGICYEGDRVFVIIKSQYMPDTRDWDTIEFYENNPVYKSVLIEVIPETVGQFTGLFDTNSKKIFEGDILGGPVRRISAKYGNLIVVTDIRECKYLALYASEYTIMGNVHDNPELLKGE